MTIAYEEIRRQCALRSGQLTGTDAATLETAYKTTAWASALDGAEVPVSAFKDTILAVEKELAEQIALDSEQPYRNALYGISAVIADGDVIPTTASGGEAFIGVFSGFVDGTDNTKTLTEGTIQEIEDLKATFFSDTQFYKFKMIAGRIKHTRTNIKAEGCIWDYATQSSAYDAAGSSPLPQSLENTLIAGVLGQFPQSSGWFLSEGASYRQIFTQGLQMLKNRSLDAPVLPTLTGANPIKE